MKGIMGHFGQVEVPKIAKAANNESDGVKVLKIGGYFLAGAVALAGVVAIMDYFDRRNYYYPNDFDAIENFKSRINDLSKKLDDGTISSKEADELYRIVHTQYGKIAGYTSKPMQGPGKLSRKLEEYFKSQGA